MKLTRTRATKNTEYAVGGTPQVNLLPPSVSENREQRALLTQWAVRVGSAAVVLLVATVGMLGWRGILTVQLASAENDGQALISQIGEKAEIQKLLDTENELAKFSEDSMATALGWKTSVGLLLNHFPEGTELCGFDLHGGAPANGDPTQAVGLSGTIELCGVFRSAQPFYVGAMSAAGIKDVVLSSGEFDTSKSVYRHLIAVEFDQSVYLSVQKELAEAAEAAESEPAGEPAEEVSEVVGEDDVAEATDEQGEAEGTE